LDDYVTKRKDHQVLVLLKKLLTSHLGDSGVTRRPTNCSKHGATPRIGKLNTMTCIESLGTIVHEF